MSSKKISFEEKVAIVSSFPLEFRHRVAFVMYQNWLMRAYNDCSCLEGDETFKMTPSGQSNESFISLSGKEKLEIISNIIAIIEDKNTLWAAVVSANPDELSNSHHEG